MIANHFGGIVGREISYRKRKCNGFPRFLKKYKSGSCVSDPPFQFLVTQVTGMKASNILPPGGSICSSVTEWLCHLVDCGPPSSAVHGISQARIPEWVAMPSSRGSSQPRDQTHISYGSCITGRFFWCLTKSLGYIPETNTTWYVSYVCFSH